MPFPGDPRSASLADLLAWASTVSAQEALATLHQMSKDLGLDVASLVRLTVGKGFSGPDAAGAAITGNPVLVGGKAGANIVPFQVDVTGNAQVVAKAINDLGNSTTLLAD